MTRSALRPALPPPFRARQTVGASAVGSPLSFSSRFQQGGIVWPGGEGRPQQSFGKPECPACPAGEGHGVATPPQAFRSGCFPRPFCSPAGTQLRGGRHSCPGLQAGLGLGFSVGGTSFFGLRRPLRAGCNSFHCSKPVGSLVSRGFEVTLWDRRHSPAGWNILTQKWAANP